MTELVTSDDLALIGTELRAVNRSVSEDGWLKWFTDRRTLYADNVEGAFRHWFGPRAEAALSAAVTYLEAIAPIVGLVRAQLAEIDRLATTVTELEPLLRDAEEQIAAHRWALSFPPGVDFAADGGPDEFVVADSRRLVTAAEQSIVELSATWVRARDHCGQNIAGINIKLTAVNDAVFPSIDGMPYVHGHRYLARVAEFAVEYDVPVVELDSSAATEANDHLTNLTAVANTGGMVISFAFDTADDGGVDNADGNVSRDDVEAMTDWDHARTQVADAADQLGLELTDDQLDTLATTAVSTAWISLANWNNDDVDPETTLETPLERRRPVEPADDDGGVPVLEENVDLSTIPSLDEALTIDVNGIGACAGINGHAGPLFLEDTGCFVIADESGGLIITYGAGVSVDGTIGTPVGATAEAGGLVTNARQVDHLEGPAVTYTIAGGAGAGGSATISFGLEENTDGTWVYNGVVAIQGNVTATTPSADVNSTITNTDVIFENGMLSILRSPLVNDSPIISIDLPWSLG